MKTSFSLKLLIGNKWLKVACFNHYPSSEIIRLVIGEYARVEAAKIYYGRDIF